MQSRKIIKKIVQSTVILLLVVFAIPASGFLLLQSSKVQTRAVNTVMQKVSEQFQTVFTIDKIDMSFFYRVRLSGVYLQDFDGDTLIYAGTVTAGIRYINPWRKEVSLGSINLNNGYLALAIDSASNLNLAYFIDQLKGDGKKQDGWKVKFNNIKVRNTRFSLKNHFYEPKEYGMNFTDIEATDIRADLKRFKPSPDSLSFVVASLSLKEKSGLIIRNMSCDFSQFKTFLSFRSLNIETAKSRISGDEITMRFPNYKAFKAGAFGNSVVMNIQLNPSTIDMAEIGYFAPVFKSFHQRVSVSGSVNGRLNNVKGKNLTVGFGDQSKLSGNLQFNGLPAINETFILADIRELSTTAGDIEKMLTAAPRALNLPEIVNKLGRISYTGNFTGFVNDFVAYGKLNTSLGTINTDLLFRPDTLNMLSFDGKIKAHDFNLGMLLDSPKSIGNISLTASISGATLGGKSITASLKGNIEHVGFRQYDYTNISISGDLKQKTFNGSINVKDPNVDLEFLGKVNFTDSIPSFDFTANITDANLYALNIDRSDPDFRVSCYLIANAQGRSLNSLNGEIKVLNSLFVKKDKQLQVYDLRLLSASASGNNHLKLRSDFLDADLDGDFELTRSGETLRKFLHAYLPSMIDSSTAVAARLNNTIDFKSTIKNAGPLLDFFMPGYEIAENSTLNLSFEPENHQLKLYLQTAYAKAGSLLWNNLNLVMEGGPDLLQMEAGGKSIVLGNSIELENFTLFANAGTDTAGVHVRWNNWQDLQYRGAINALAKVSRPNGRDNPIWELNFSPSSFITNDTLWTVQPGKITIDSNAISLNNISVKHNNDLFLMEGLVSENPEDELHINFSHFNLGNLNGVLVATGFELGGILNGKATLSNLYSSPLFTSLMQIDSLAVNREMLGNTQISSEWDDKRKALLVDAFALRDKLKTFNIRGEYIPAEQGRLSFNLEMEKFRLNVFNPYVRGIFSDLRGIASGKASLTGTIAKPVLNGEISLQKTSLLVNYLKTRYSFSDNIQVENNNILFRDISIYDAGGNTALLNGAIRNRYLKDFNFDLTIRPREFMCLNTSAADNKLFYGTAYATGLVKITGQPKNMVMDISARTVKNTRVNIPLSNTGELNEYPFIAVDHSREDDSDKTALTSDYQVDLSGLQINMALEVTPEAEVQIIFDPKLGDIIRGRGTGNLDMKINTSGNFLMYGDYTIEEGNYLFTLQNIINKPLTIEPGGQIRWNGDPLDATINIVAYYRTRASLNDLLGTKDQPRVVVDDRITMTGKLMSPDVKYDIHLPYADESIRLRVNGHIASSDELNKQFISLLTLNRFYFDANRSVQSAGTSTASPYSGAAGVSASEFLSNQLSNWLSQIISDVDVDFNYRSDREMKSDEVQFALSYQMFNDRLTINGSVDYATNAAAAARKDLVGEFDIDYTLTSNGKVKLKTYNHANNDLLYEHSPYTQGFGFTYKEEFDTFGELLRRYFRFLGGKKQEKPPQEPAQKP
ncbi:MAG: translocation/assembly module TamB [Bacteroidales bacterium]|nr:translocation/assembly module TamB [Bacteroidales bacterium]